MVIFKGKILAVGKSGDLEERFENAIIYDLNGNTVLPGMIDSHTHVHELGFNRNKANVEETESVEEMVKILVEYYPEPKPGEWIIGTGWDEGAWASKRYPDRKLLDETFPDNPVVLESLHTFAGFYNGKTLEISGITSDTPDPEGGQILKRDDGIPTGILLSRAQNLVTQHIPPESYDQEKQAIISGLQALADVGVTSVHEIGMDAGRIKVFRELASNNELPVRVYGVLTGTDDDLVNEWIARGPEIDNNLWFSLKGIKIFYDGSMGSRTALLKEPYSDEPEKANPDERLTQDELAVLSKKAAASGFQMIVHAIGDEANDRTLNAFELALKEFPNIDHRWRIEHAQTVLPDYYERAAGLNVISSMQSSHAILDSPWAEDRVGKERIRHSYAWKNVLTADGKLIINSDLPAVPWEPMQTLYFAVNRAPLGGSKGDEWYPEQSITVNEALKAMTIESAYAAFQENFIGSIKVGKLADFIEIDKNPFKIDPFEIDNIKVLKTWINGEIVFQKK